ncbi:hypothetical protein QOT17_016946 [Balamuthia mandrillaris]
MAATKLAIALFVLSAVLCLAQAMTIHEETSFFLQQDELLGGNKGGTTCTVCKYLLKYVEDLVAKNKTVVQITKMCMTMCGIIPGEMSEVCKGFVSYYVPLMIYMLVEQNQPDQVCADIGVCPRPSFFFMNALSDNEKCSMCEAVAAFTQTYLNNGAEAKTMLAELNNAVEELCLLLSSPAQCYAVVDQHFVSIYKALR